MTGASRTQPGDRPCLPYLVESLINNTHSHARNESLDVTVPRNDPRPGPMKSSKFTGKFNKFQE